MGSSDAKVGRARALTGAVLAPVVFIGLWFAPLPLEEPAHRLAAIFAAIVVLWVSEVVPIAVTALLVAPLLVLCGVTTPKEAFRHYADPLLYLFVGGFIIARAMHEHGLDRRIARAIVGSRWVAGMPTRSRIALMVAGLAISMWVSNTATAAMLLPIALGMLGPRPEAGGDQGATGSLLAVTHACSVGGMATMIGSPPNLMTVRLLAEGGVTLGFVDWMMIGLPTALLILVALYFLMHWMFPPVASDPEQPADPFGDVPSAWSRGEAVTAVAFGLAVVGWTVPGAANALALPIADDLRRYLDPSVVAVLAASVLFFLPDGRGGRVLRWHEAVQIDWGIILLFGGGIALGTQLVETGLAAVISEGFVLASGVSDVWMLTAICIVVTIALSELCSNTATAAMLVPLVLAVTETLGVSPVAPVLAVGLAASVGFMLPIATGPNALVYGTGRVSQPQMIRAGFALDVVAGILVFAAVRVLCPLFGWI